MQKVFTILLLMVSLIGGSLVSEAKKPVKKATRTTQAAKKAANNFNVTGFVEKNESGYNVRYNKSLITSSGFRFIETLYSDMDDSETNYYENSRGETVSVIDNGEGILEINFEFNSTESRDKFLTGREKLFHLEDGEYFTDGAHDRVRMQISGKEVILSDM